MTVGMVLRAQRRFRAWFEWLGVTQEELAKRLSCDQSHVSKLLSEERRPGLAIAAAIETESAGWPKGPIKVTEWSEVKAKVG
jgi:transcriptional regulator with XRE-family HTH domain